MSVDAQAGPARGRPRVRIDDAALDAAMVVFWEAGYAGVDTETLCRRMQVSKPRLYRHYGSKEQVFLGALAHYERRVGGALFDPLRAPLPFAEALRRCFARVVENVTGRYGPTGCLLACVATAATAQSPKVRAFLSQEAARTQSFLEARLACARDAGDLLPGVVPRHRARLIQDLIHAVAVRGRCGEDADSIRTSLPTYLTILTGA